MVIRRLIEIRLRRLRICKAYGGGNTLRQKGPTRQLHLVPINKTRLAEIPPLEAYCSKSRKCSETDHRSIVDQGAAGIDSDLQGQSRPEL